MSGLPYYPRYPRDFLDGTVGMPMELKGAYSILLDLIYLMGDRGLVDDPRFISGHLGCSVRKWNNIKTDLVSRGKISIENGIISNFRADKEQIIQRKYRDKQRENRAAPNKNNGLKSPPSNHTDTDTDTYVVDDARGRDLTHRETLLEAMGLDRSGLSATGQLRGNSGDMDEARRWGEELGLSLQEQLAVIRDVMGQRSTPPNSFKYFTGAMQDAAGRKSLPKLQATTPAETVAQFPSIKVS